MRNRHKLVLFFKNGLSGTRFVQLLSNKYGSGFANDDRMYLKSIITHSKYFRDSDWLKARALFTITSY